MNNFSPNMLKSFEECPMKFFFKYVQKISMPARSKFFEKGKKIHALANYSLNGADISKMENVLTFDEKKAWEALKSNKYFNFEPINTEYNLSCKVGNYWIGGRLDAWVKEGESYFILDYKTGSIPKNPEQDFQTIVYLLAVDKFLTSKNLSCKSLSFIYLDLKNNSEHTILLTDELKKKYEEKIISTCEKIDFTINSNSFSKKLERCKSCEYNKICQI